MIAQNLRYYWRQHLTVAAGTAVGALILVGALLVGDSMRFSLERLARLRLGKIDSVVVHPTGFFREKLADDLGGVPALLLRGSVTTLDESRRVNQVQIVGVDDRFWSFAGKPVSLPAVNAVLADRLGQRAGDVVVRLEKPSWLPREAPLGQDKDTAVAARIAVAGVAGDEALGRFSLTASQITPPTLFVPLAWLQAETDRRGRANVVLLPKSVAVAPHWTLDDAELEWKELPDGRGQQLSARGVFFNATIPGAQPIFTYLANELRHGDHAAPYAIVAAGTETVGADEIVINQWLADDLQAKAGDEIAMTYYVVGPLRTLTEQTTSFRVARIVPVERDPDLMPAFPGLYGAKSCREWDPGIPMDLTRLRDKDQAYWETYRGTPKAFIALPTARRIWETRFGNLTALRWPAAVPRAEIETAVRATLRPPAVQPVRELAAKARGEALDFGQLFLGFSFFLISAAVVLTGMLFAFGIQQRAREIGTLRALGWPAGRVRRVFLTEGLVVALAGAAAGTALGMVYTQAALAGLMGLWRGAVAGTELVFHATLPTVLTGFVAAVGIVVGVIGWSLRRQAKLPARVLLQREVVVASGGRRWPWSAPAATAVAILLLVVGGGHAGVFFAAGALLLVAAIGFSRHVVGGGRRLATVAVLACGVFLVVAVGANRHAPDEQGTGGFALLGELTVPVARDLNDAKVQDEWGLPAAHYVPVRVREGDDASCLNLNRAQTPRLLGVRPADFAGRFAADWARLEENGAAVPAIGDEATVRWGLGRKVGDTLMFTDDRGTTFPVWIVGLMANSILQGSLIISDRHFVEKFPTASGCRLVLVSGTEDAAAVRRALANYGADVQPTSVRLAALQAVENTYLAIFQALGGLGLVLGCVGLGVVVLRNVLERRSELALRRVVGFSQRRLRGLVLGEHWLLVALGLVSGGGAAVVAVIPAVRSAAAIPVGELAATLVVIAGTAAIWIWLATRAALRGRLLDALRAE